MQLHELKSKTKRKISKRIGRGGKRGKTSGKGGKGQTARAGGRPRPEMRDTIKRLPKRRGFGKNRARTINPERIRPQVVNLSALEIAFATGAEVNPQTLFAADLVKRDNGAIVVKILGTGELTKKLSITGCEVSASAREKITAVGGTIV